MFGIDWQIVAILAILIYGIELKITINHHHHYHDKGKGVDPHA